MITAKRGTAREPVPAGTFPARCYKIMHLGTSWDERLQKMQNKIRLDWELPTETKIFDPEKGEQPLSISKDYTLSMNEKSNLCKDLESWKGKKFTDPEAEAFDITSVLGNDCLINIAHKVSNSSGNVYAYVASVVPMPKGMECPPPVNPPFIWDFDEHFDESILEGLHEFFQGKIKSSEEYKAKMDPIEVQETPDPGYDDIPPEVGEDGLPF